MPVVIITGGSRGIGKATAETFLEHGWAVSMMSRTESQLIETCAELEPRFPNRVFFSAGDVSNEKDVFRLFADTEKALGTPSCLICNAGIYQAKNLADQSVEDWQSVMDVNVRGSFLCCRSFIRSCESKALPGSIVLIGSLAGIRSTQKFPGFTSYAASKSALVGFTECLAEELKPSHIRVNCIAPGAVDTEMLRKALPHLKAEATPHQLAQLIYKTATPIEGILTGSILEIHSNAK